MRKVLLIPCTFLLSACANTGGDLVQPDQASISPGRAVIAFSAEIADGTDYEQCSIFLGRSPSTAKWFAWNIAEGPTALFALEVDALKYGFHRFGCVYSGLSLSTSIPGPELQLNADAITYLGRLMVKETELGTAAGYSRMPTAVKLQFEDHSDADLESLRSRLALFAGAEIGINILRSWSTSEMIAFRPYRHGPQVIVSPALPHRQ